MTLRVPINIQISRHTILAMEDAVRPSKEAFKAMYERGYRTWYTIGEAAVADIHLPMDCLSRLQSAFPSHPHFPDNLTVNASFSNTVTVRGRTAWTTTQGTCDLQPFQEEVVLQVASPHETTVVFTSVPRQPVDVFPALFSTNDNHIPVLMLAWAYILSARWAELIPGTHALQYSSSQAQQDPGRVPELLEKTSDHMVVDIGDVDEDAIRWWAAILAPEIGWNASIRSDTGALLCSPWSTNTQSKEPFLLSANAMKAHTPLGKQTAASFETALRYLSEYCDLHNVADQNQAALAAALLIPVAKFDKSMIEMPILRISKKIIRRRKGSRTPLAWDGGKCQLDRLLALSCNVRGIKALLNSVFFERDIACNVCGAWLQGSFAFLDSGRAKDPRVLLRMLMGRNPSLGSLWAGAFITGAQRRCLQEARVAWWKVELNAAAWTGTYASFIQEPMTKIPPDSDEISRADECRLMYLSHGANNITAPLFPFAPFGSTAMEDTTLDVRKHAQCEGVHSLGYGGFTWDCLDSGKAEEVKGDAVAIPICANIRAPVDWDASIAVDYDGLDFDDESSEMVTRNVFTWLRGDDGFPVAERAIREHEWLGNLESDDDTPVGEGVRSVTRGDISGWILETATKRSDLP